MTHTTHSGGTSRRTLLAALTATAASVPLASLATTPARAAQTAPLPPRRRAPRSRPASAAPFPP
ncbi:hypothetical protein [Streptomyces sp. NPDC012450]|uniref:hypothetical protein n=1 Tax=Streptomyces sp. NPDC012450 TaxID=3364834 RepID=UPI0036EF5BCC